MTKQNQVFRFSFKCIKNKELKYHIYISIQTLYSVLCWSAFGSDYSLKPSWVWCYKLGTPVFGGFLPFFSADPLKLCEVGWEVSLHSYFQSLQRCSISLGFIRPENLVSHGLGQLYAALWDSRSQLVVTQPGIEPGSLMTPQALRCSATAPLRRPQQGISVFYLAKKLFLLCIHGVLCVDWWWNYLIHFRIRL